MLYEKIVRESPDLAPMSLLVLKNENIIEEVGSFNSRPGALERIGKYLSFVTEMIRDEVSGSGAFYGFFDGEDVKILFAKENRTAIVAVYPFNVNTSKVLKLVKEVEQW